MVGKQRKRTKFKSFTSVSTSSPRPPSHFPHLESCYRTFPSASLDAVAAYSLDDVCFLVPLHSVRGYSRQQRFTQPQPFRDVPTPGSFRIHWLRAAQLPSSGRRRKPQSLPRYRKRRRDRTSWRLHLEAPRDSKLRLLRTWAMQVRSQSQQLSHCASERLRASGGSHARRSIPGEWVCRFTGSVKFRMPLRGAEEDLHRLGLY